MTMTLTDKKIAELLSAFSIKELNALTDFISFKKAKNWHDLDDFDKVVYLFDIIKASEGQDWSDAEQESKTLDKIYNARIELKALSKAFQYLD